MRPVILMLILAGSPWAGGAGAEEPKVAANLYNQSAETFLVQPTVVVASKGRVVKDAAARSGWAICADPASMPGSGYLWYGYAYSQGPGKLRYTYRLKVADNTSPKPVASVQVCIWENDLKQDPNREEVIRGTDFRAPNTYQEFSFDTVKGEAGFAGWGVQTTGVTALSWDGLSIEQVTRFTTEELLALVKQPERPATLSLAPVPWRLHETYGLYMPLWGVKEAVALLAARTPGAQRTQSTLNVHPQKTSLADYPIKWEDLYSHAVVVLNNVPAKAVSLVGCLILKQYVEDGGCLVLMGDTHGFAAGGWDESVLGPLLPVTLAEDDRVHPAAPLVLSPQAAGLRGLGLDWAAQPYTLYYHRAAVKPGAEVLVAAGEAPLVVQGQAGKGRVVVFLNAVLGEKSAQAAGVPFWEWRDWPRLMAAVLAQEAGDHK